MKGNLENVRLLCEGDSKVIDARNKCMMSPLYLAILNEHIECAQYLIEQGAKVFFDDDGDPLARETSPIFLAIRNEQLDILSDIYDFNFPIVAFDSQGLSPLMYAAKRKKEKVVDMLTLRSENLNEENQCLTILMMLLLEGNFKSARKLVNRGADINYQNQEGNTALHVCIMKRNMPGIEWLLQQKKCDKSLKNKQGDDVCDLARRIPELDRFQEFKMNASSRISGQLAVISPRHLNSNANKIVSQSPITKQPSTFKVV